jgi:ribonuclease P protein component
MRVRRFGKSYAHPLLVIVFLNGEFGNSRAGFITGKSIGNAVKRNRIKRQLKAILSNLLPSFHKNTDLLVIAREPICKASFGEIRAAVHQLLMKAELI